MRMHLSGPPSHICSYQSNSDLTFSIIKYQAPDDLINSIEAFKVTGYRILREHQSSFIKLNAPRATFNR